MPAARHEKKRNPAMQAGVQINTITDSTARGTALRAERGRLISPDLIAGF
jgi:hypothetical protein